MKAFERLLKYVTFDTRSDDSTGTTPSTEKQLLLAKELAKELTEVGCQNVFEDEKCYVYAVIPATIGCEAEPSIGFIAHMDTSPDFNGNGVAPKITENYDGEELKLGDSGRVLSPVVFPHLKTLKGRTLITTSGNSLLGADDKAGIAEIMTMAERLIKSNIPHGKICIAFTPDEEIGEGADHFDIERFGADFAYTVDGGREGAYEYENFNAAAADFEINGFNVHPGAAKNVMINASLVAMEINSSLPQNELPSKTEGYEGFYHLTDMHGNVEKATLSYIIRDHSAQAFDKRLDTLKSISNMINKKYGNGTVTLRIKEQYRNMAEIIESKRFIIERAEKAIKKCGIEPLVEPIRGGTDGARLSYMGLPCPNLGTGGYAFHGPFEHITAEGMDISTDILIEIARAEI